MSEPDCTCTSTGKVTRFDRECFYHGDHGTMVTRIDLRKFQPKRPPKVVYPSCPTCGRPA